MKISLYLVIAPGLSFLAPAQTTPDVGSGAPNLSIQQGFQQAYFRGSFMTLVSLPPLGNVKTLGVQGLVQEFADASKSTANKYALVDPNVSASIPLVYQVYAPLYSVYTMLGPTTAGYPTGDTRVCPIPGCYYQLFDKPYAIFGYSTALPNGSTTLETRDPFFTKWQALGGIATLGAANSAEQTITSAAGNGATVQTFQQGAVFSITSGLLTGRVAGIAPTVYAAYTTVGGYRGFLGLPASDETILSSGVHRQQFEGGFVDYTPGSPAVAHYSISDIIVTPVTSLKLNVGDTIVLTATPYDPNGNALTDRSVAWTTSNSRVVMIQSTAGQTVTIKAVGGGAATVTASAEGKASLPVAISITAQCCGLGEGAPTTQVRQEFEDAVARNHLSVQLPAAGPVQRAGSGYIQTLADAQTGATYLIAVADGSGSAYLVKGALLSAYLALGGPSGSLGYPASDVTPGGRQMFTNQAALAGSPVQAVTGIMLIKWAALGYETGPLGPPTSGLSPVLSFQATAGTVQFFRGGSILASAGKAWSVTGLVLAAYMQAGGATGSLGLPTDDEYVAGARRRQDFEGGYIDYSPGDATAAVHPGTRHPQVTATPTQPVAGSKVQLALGGFDAGSTLRVSVTGQPDFTVNTSTGAYIWSVAVPAASKAGTVSIRAVDLATMASAIGSYTVRLPSQVSYQLTKISGDGQTAAPGAVLSQPLRILIKDDAGNPAVGLPVTFAASPGAQIVMASPTTDASGQAMATLRLAGTDGLVLATGAAGSQVVTFSAQAVHATLPNFPSVSQVAQGGSMLASAAAILRFYQNRGELPNSNGFADPQVLNQYLRSFCINNTQGIQTCDGFVLSGSADQFINLWRLGSFAGAPITVTIQPPDPSTIKGLLGQSQPVLLELALAGGTTHFVVATGTTADGGITIMDPDPSFARARLADYLTGGATLTDVIQIAPEKPATAGFLVTGDTPVQIVSPAGTCGLNLDLGPALHQTFCSGTQSVIELDIAATQSYNLSFTDLATPGNQVSLVGSGPAAYTLSHSGPVWTAAPATPQFTAAAIVNAASFTPALAPGGLFTIFGSGLTQGAMPVSIQIGGEEATVIAASPFQVSGQVPPDLEPGSYQMTLSSPRGSNTQLVTIQRVAPAIFQLPNQYGAILNQNGTVNSPDNPAQRGQAIVIYTTGLGVVSRQRNLDIVQDPPAVVIEGTELQPFFAGLSPGFIGLYQINVSLPSAIAPGLTLTVIVRQNDITSNPVELAVQ